MSVVDKVLGALTPPESDEARREATQKARALSRGDDWLAMALDHHEAIRAAFETCRTADTPHARKAAMRSLGEVLNGHALAEEVVLYPAMAKADEKGHAGMAYSEQTTTKMQMAELERIDPEKDAWLDKLEHIRGAVLHHMYEEEHTWFPELLQQYEDQAFLTLRFCEEYERYCGVGGEDLDERAAHAPRDEPRSFVSRI
ncbi:MAG: hemerythrin domain-containing protein [Pseudomonadota bacterium]